jgi:hypothetical protein
MKLPETFEVMFGRTAGREHRIAGNLLNCQDAVGACITDSQIIGALSDGSGSQPHSEFGSELTVNQLLKLVTRRLRLNQPLNDEWFNGLYKALVRHIVATAKANFLNPVDALNTHMMATAGGLILGEEETTFYGAGDFFIVINGEVHEWKPEEGNKPLYPILSVAFAGDKRFAFKTLTVPTAELQSFAFGTDGFGDLLKVCASADEYYPGTDTVVGPIDQIWTNDKFYTDPAACGLWLNSLAQNWRMPGPPHHGGLLDDDTTFIAGRRKEVTVA